ncbi:MAG: quinolinate synthase NadA, partial [Deltaproteobacteria bacterium]|nr:quinolinate synthase NadA [Deltaproteobacteria bacterium]
IQKANPGKKFFPASAAMICPDMKVITLEDVARSLEFMEGVVRVPEDIRVPALRAVERMINL